MTGTSIRRLVIVLAQACVGWALCMAAMGIGMAITSVETTLIVHAIAAPIIFAAVSLIYSRNFGYTTPQQTAIAFVALVVFADFFIVAVLVLKSFDLFASILGTWVPFALIFVSTYLAGVYPTGHKRTVITP